MLKTLLESNEILVAIIDEAKEIYILKLSLTLFLQITKNKTKIIPRNPEIMIFKKKVEVKLKVSFRTLSLKRNLNLDLPEKLK